MKCKLWQSVIAHKMELTIYIEIFRKKPLILTMTKAVTDILTLQWIWTIIFIYIFIDKLIDINNYIDYNICMDYVFDILIEIVLHIVIYYGRHI